MPRMCSSENSQFFFPRLRRSGTYHSVASMSWTIEPGTSASCASAEGYVTAPSTPTFIPAHDLPATVCAIAADAAGNSSQPVAIRVGVS